jgi:putative ABC transport system permease protein
MIKNYFKIAWRNLLKQKTYSVIKISGFALGIAACLLIGIFIRNEISYDKNIPDADRIYRLEFSFTMNGETKKSVYFPAPLAKVLTDDFPEVEQTGRYMPTPFFQGAGSNLVRPEDMVQNTYEEGFTYIDQSLVNILQIPFVYGDPRHALDEPNTIVLSKSKADKYFPNENPVGKTLILNNNKANPYKIGGVMKDFPATSHLHFDFLLTMTGKEFWKGEQASWVAGNYPTYIKLRPGANADAMVKKISSINKTYFIPNYEQAGFGNMTNVVNTFVYSLQPVTDIYLRTVGVDDKLAHGDIRFIWLFAAIAFAILLIACINFINLSTAKSANRAVEVGIRKVMGSIRKNLIGQFLAESILYSALSFLLGTLLAWILLPYFNVLASKELFFPWQEWWLLPVILGASVLVGLLAGLYPSFYLSSFNPAKVLKGTLQSGSKRSGFRNALVIFQFTTSIILIIGTVVTYQQMRYVLNKDVGFKKDQVLEIYDTYTLGNRMSTFKKELLQLPQVSYASASGHLPIAGTKRNMNTFWEEGKADGNNGVQTQIWKVDHDYIKTMSMKVVKGRDFSIDLPTDSQAVIINQAMAKQMGFENPIGKRITNKVAAYSIIGVVKDFNFESLKENIKPVCLAIGNETSIVSVKVKTSDIAGSIQSIKKVWQSLLPDQPFRYGFLDESFANTYKDVDGMGRILTNFAMLAIILACVGLLALSAFMAEQRSKEISIRKVLGASAGTIFGMLTKNFLILVLVSLIIAVPIGWYMMQKWLEDFAYRVSIGWEVFVLAGLAAVLITLLTISFQSLRAAVAKPIDSLREK